MAATQINTHLGKNISWTVYRNGHNAWQGQLTSSGSAYDITGRAFVAYIRRVSKKNNLLTLSEGIGITNGGATGVLTIELSQSNIVNLKSDRYFIVVEYTIDGKVYPFVQGYITISSEVNPGTTLTSVTIPVDIDGVTVSMEVTMVSPSFLIANNRQTESYTLALSDAGKIVDTNSSSVNNVTIPPNSSVAFPLGTQILIAQYGLGQSTIVAGSGVTIRSSNGYTSLSGQYSAASLIKIGTNEWYLFGDLA